MTNKEAIEELKKVDTLDMPARLCEAHYMAIKALEQEPILDKIRAEIEEKYPSCQCTGESTGYAEAVEDFLQIFDKYKAESEEV
jgi:hypothetical protein